MFATVTLKRPPLKELSFKNTFYMYNNNNNNIYGAPSRKSPETRIRSFSHFLPPSLSLTHTHTHTRTHARTHTLQIYALLVINRSVCKREEMGFQFWLKRVLLQSWEHRKSEYLRYGGKQMRAISSCIESGCWLVASGDCKVKEWFGFKMVCWFYRLNLETEFCQLQL